MANPGVPKKMLGIIFLIAGAGLAFWGFQKSRGLESKLSSALTGSYTDNVMVLIIAGAICLAIGLFLVARK